MAAPGVVVGTDYRGEQQSGGKGHGYYKMGQAEARGG